MPPSLERLEPLERTHHRVLDQVVGVEAPANAARHAAGRESVQGLDAAPGKLLASAGIAGTRTLDEHRDRPDGRSRRRRAVEVGGGSTQGVLQRARH